MTFSVNTTALGGLPLFLDRRESDLKTTQIYLRTNTTLRYGSGLATIAGHHQATVGAITRYLDDAAGNYAGTDALRLREAINAYTYADVRAARRSDAALPPWHSRLPMPPPLDETGRSLGPFIFDDVSTPLAGLIEPIDHHLDMPYEPGWFDLLSPGSILRDVIWYVSGVAARFGLLDRAYDPFEYLVGPYIGDWAGLLRCAEVFEHVGDLLLGDALAIEIAYGLVPSIWTGNAAGLCVENLSDFVDCLRDGVLPLRNISATYRAVARGAHDNAMLLSTLLTDLFDYGVGAAADIETLGLFSAYEVGSALGDFAKTLRQALNLASACQDLVSAGFRMSDDIAHRLGFLAETVSMPSMIGPTPAIAPGPELPPRSHRIAVAHV